MTIWRYLIKKQGKKATFKNAIFGEKGNCETPNAHTTSHSESHTKIGVAVIEVFAACFHLLIPKVDPLTIYQDHCQNWILNTDMTLKPYLQWFPTLFYDPGPCFHSLGAPCWLPPQQKEYFSGHTELMNEWMALSFHLALKSIISMHNEVQMFSSLLQFEILTPPLIKSVHSSWIAVLEMMTSIRSPHCTH